MRPTFAVLLVAAAFAAGCPKPTYPECKTDADCKDHGQLCVSGFCRECRDDSQCKPGQICKDNACSERAQCSSASDCPSGQKCAAGSCVAECSEASAARDCGPGRRCLAGRCAAADQCLSDADCAENMSCEGGACREKAKGSSCNLEPVHFGFDESQLGEEARRVLEADWRCIQERGAKAVTIAGNTDERGTTEYNLALGSRRAEAVRRYLVQLGADRKSLRTVSYGKERPVDPGHDESAWAKNRRADLSEAR